MLIRIPINPTAKARARKGRQGKFYTPEKTKKAEYDIGMIVRIECNRQGISYSSHKPLEVIVTFCIKQPKRCKHDYPITRPDLDNYIKLILDSLKGIIPDDAQIVHIDAWKRYTDKEGFIELEVREI